MRQILFAAVAMLAACQFHDTADAGGRGRMERAYANAYARTMRLNYPGPWGIRWRNYADTRVFSQDGFLDRALERLLDEIGAADSASDFHVATTAPTPNPVLESSLVRSRRILATLKIEDPDGAVQQSSGTQPEAGLKNSRVNDLVP